MAFLIRTRRPPSVDSTGQPRGEESPLITALDPEDLPVLLEETGLGAPLRPSVQATPGTATWPNACDALRPLDHFHLACATRV